MTQLDEDFNAAEISAQAAKDRKSKTKYVLDENPRGSFIAELGSLGFVVPALPVVGKLERIPSPVDKKGKKSGWYVYNEVPDDYSQGQYIGIGVYGSWNCDPEHVVWTSKSRDLMTPTESKRFEEQLRADKEARDLAMKEIQAEVAVKAQIIWDEAMPAPEGHPYLETKGIKPHGLRVSRGCVIVPVQDKGKIVSMQFIGIDGQKNFLKGGKVMGCSYKIDGDEQVVFIAEGVATGATIHEATGACVYVAYHGGNLKAVHQFAKEQNPDAIVIIAGDDDCWKDVNSGRTKAEAIKDAFCAFPIFEDVSSKPTDFNDLHCLEGIDAVKAQLATALDRATPPTYDDCMAAAEVLNKESAPEDIDEVLAKIARFKPKAIEQRKLMDATKKASGISLGDLKDGLKEQQSENNSDGADDLANALVKEVLKCRFNGGAHLIRATDQCFWQFNGKHWTSVQDEYIKSILLEAIENDADCEPGEVGYCGMLNSAFTLLIARQAAYADKLRLHDDPPPVINCNNGELWINENGEVELLPHRFESYLTSVLSVDYLPMATCPKFDQALLDIFQKSTNPADMARHYMEFMGYAIQPQRQIAAWFLHYGKGRNGKTKLMETMEKLMSTSAIHAGRIGEFENNRFAIGSLPGKLILLDDDVDTGTKLPDGFLKSVSERKLLTGEIKYKNHFEFIATCLPVLLANNLPYTADVSLGIRRRAHIIPFAHVFTDADADNQLFPYIWKHELSGVLNRAIEGLRKLRARGAFDQPQDCLDAQQVWLNSANPLTAFIDERCSSNADAFVPIKALYEALKFWAEECGIRKIPTRNTVKANLEGLGYTVQRRDAGNAVYGLELNGSHFGEP